MSFSPESLHLERAEGGREALRQLERLRPDERREVLRLAEELAGHGLGVARAFLLRAPKVVAQGGLEALRRWVKPAEALVPGHRETAVAALSVEPASLLSASPALLERWTREALRIQDLSRRLAVAFVEGTGPSLADLASDGEERLRVWADAAIGLTEAVRWRGELLAVDLLDSAGKLLGRLEPAEIEAWVALGREVQQAGRAANTFFRDFPEALAALPGRDRRAVLALCRRITDPEAAFAVFGQIGAELSGFVDDERAALLEGLSAAADHGGELARLVPLLGAIGRVLPPDERAALFRRAAGTARRFPECFVPLFRSLPRAREEAELEAIERWIAYGEGIAETHPGAGRAYFALVSRTGLEELRSASTAVRVEDVKRVLRAFARMLSGRPLEIRGAEGHSLRPFLDVAALDGSTVTLPDPVNAFDSWEENFSLFKVMTVNAIGRILHGTHELSISAVADRLPESLGRLLRDTVPGNGLEALLEAFPPGDALVRLFAACEGARLDARLRKTFRGFDAEIRTLADRFRREAGRSGAVASPELILFLLGAGTPISGLPDGGPVMQGELLELVTSLLLSPAATAEDALAAAVLLRERFGETEPAHEPDARYSWEELLFEQMVAEREGDDGLVASDEEDAAGTGAREVVEGEPKAIEEDDESGGGVPLSAEELQRMLREGLILKIGREGGTVESAGIFVSGAEAPPGEGGDTPATGVRPDGGTAARRGAAGRSRAYEYDEWDHQIRDYRERWCRLEEIVLPGDSGEFFQEAMSRHSDLLPEVRRQFQRIPPERYRRIRGLEDGEDFDLNAVVDLRVDVRARRSPDPRVYVARKREERDVATLFLLDMSASTDEALPATEDEAPEEEGKDRRVIDVTKEALVIMAEALEEIGDQYAIYGFSGEGRKNVEVYRVKRFQEGLSAVVRSRIGGIEPRRSTRMGAAIRHAIPKLHHVAARSKHLLLLSDGFPQDFDYGDDRRSNVYGIQDTMKALQECQSAGITPFCITVDKTGHDYLREMCATSQYLVIEDVAALPSELPKIYERWIQG